MAKKKKKKLKAKSKLISKKKIRRWLLRLALVSIGISTGILVRPSIIQDPVKRAQVETIREQILQANESAQEKAFDVLGETSEVVQETVEKVTQITKETTNTDPQIIIKETVTNLTEEVKELPEEQIKKIKLEFCRDILEEAK